MAKAPNERPRETLRVKVGVRERHTEREMLRDREKETERERG